MSRINYIHLFSYYFFKNLILFLGIFYAEDNFRKSLQAFTLTDVLQSCTVIFIIFLAWSTSSQSFEMFELASKKTRFLFGITAGLTSIFLSGYLLSVYF